MTHKNKPLDPFPVTNGVKGESILNCESMELKRKSHHVPESKIKKKKSEKNVIFVAFIYKYNVYL